MKVWTNYKRRTEAEKFKEVFTLPSLTDQLDDEPIINILNRFVAHDGTLPTMTGSVNADDLTSNAAVDEAFAHLEGTDASDLSKVEQQDVLATAQLLVEQLQASSAAKQSEKSLTDAPETQSQKASATDAIVEGKNQN